jgi:hypothetical protein
MSPIGTLLTSSSTSRVSLRTTAVVHFGFREQVEHALPPIPDS